MKNHFLLVSSGQQKRSYFFVLYCLIDLINNQYNPSIRHMISRLCGEISLNGKIMLLVQVDMDTCTQPITSTGVLPSNQVPVLSLFCCATSSVCSVTVLMPFPQKQKDAEGVSSLLLHRAFMEQVDGPLVTWKHKQTAQITHTCAV